MFRHSELQSKIDATHYLPTYISDIPSAAELAGLSNTLSTIEARSARVPAFYDPNNHTGPNFQMESLAQASKKMKCQSLQALCTLAGAKAGLNQGRF